MRQWLRETFGWGRRRSDALCSDFAFRDQAVAPGSVVGSCAGKSTAGSS